MAEIPVPADIAGSIWKIVVTPGDRVSEDDTLVIMESMKMEVAVNAPQSGVVAEIRVREGDVVAEGDVIATLQTG